MNCQRLAAAIRDAPKRMPTSIPSVGQASILTSPPSTNLIKEESTIEAISTSIENFLFRISLVLLLILLVTVFLLWRLAGKSDNKLEYTPIRDNEDNDKWQCLKLINDDSGDVDDDDSDAYDDANDGKMHNFVVVVLFAGDW